MTMWIVRIVMPYDDELGFGDAHHLHVFKGYLSHEIIRQTWLVLGLEAQSYVPTGFLILGFSCLCSSKLCVISAFVLSNTPSEAMIFASSLPVT